jgi:hypothetical protein
MASELLNRYEIRNKRLALVGGDVSVREKEKYKQKSKLKSTAEGMGLDILVGVLGGGVASALLGKYSFLVGLGVSGIGHFSENKALTALGLGMMASGTFTALTSKQQDEKKPLPDRIKERLEAFKEELKQKVFFDKIPSLKNKDAKNEKAKEKPETKKSDATEVKDDAPKEELSGTKKDILKEQEDFIKSEIERVTKEAEAEVEIEYAQYQQMLKEKQAKEAATKSSTVKTSSGYKKDASATDTADKQKNDAKDLKKTVNQMESEDNPLY